MIEKIMKAVKSGNKKRGRNITIGAVVGMLLSCTVVMGADVTGLEIKDNGGNIEFKDKDGKEFTLGSTDDPYPENTWEEESNTYTNNSIISGTTEDGDGYGILISSEFNGNLTNNGKITGNGPSGGFGIYTYSDFNGNLINNGEIAGTGTSVGYGIAIASDFDGNLTNNGEIAGTGSSGGYGIHTSSDFNGNLTNNGAISGTSEGGVGYGIAITSDFDGNLTNNGKITSNGPGGGYGIAITSDFNGNLTNNGEITVGRGDYGIWITRDFNGNLTNNGEITVSGSDSNTGIATSFLTGELINNGVITSSSTNKGSGMKVTSNLTNNGITTGSSSDKEGFGIAEFFPSTSEQIINTGIVYGSTNAIYIEDGTLENLSNYGLLVTSGDAIIGVSEKGKVAKENKYGLAFKVDESGKYSVVESDDFSKFGTISGDDEYTVVNAKADGNAGEITGTKSLILKEGKLTYYDSMDNEQIESISPDKKYVFNGITDTLKVSGLDNELNNSRVNAYETAVVMGEDKSMLTLDNTIVNGGMKEDTKTVNIECDGSALTVKGDSVINTKADGVAIKVSGKNNAVTLEGNAIVNGKMESIGGNTLNLNGKTEGSMNMFHDISGFTNMNIDNNVTFFEDTEVTGTDTVTVKETGVLSLRLKKTEDSSGDIPAKADHAFSNRTDKHEMTIEGSSKDEAGTLNFITNGIGRVIDVDKKNITLKNMKITANCIIDKAEIHEDFIRLGAGSDLDGIVNPKEVKRYDQLNKIYKSIYSSREENIDGLRDILDVIFLGENYDYNNGADEEQLANLLSYLGSIYTEAPYSFSSELSRRSMGMFRDIVTENEFRPNQDNWLIMGGLTHTDGGTKDTYYGRNYHGFDTGSSDTDADMKLTGAYMLAKYGYSENLSLGVTLGGNKSEAEMSTSKVKGNSGYLGAFAENYRGNLTLKAGAGVQYSEYDADRSTLRGHSYSDKYSDMTYDIYLNGRYSHQVGDNLFLEPYATLSYTYVDQDGANEGNKTLAIETDSKSFDYTVGKVGVDLKKVIPHEKGKSTLTAGVSYTKILDGADEEHITGRFKGGSDFDILVAHKNEQSIGLNAKYALELENGVVFDVKGSYSVEEDSHNSSSKNKSKGEWIVGAGIGYKF